MFGREIETLVYKIGILRWGGHLRLYCFQISLIDSIQWATSILSSSIWSQISSTTLKHLWKWVPVEWKECCSCALEQVCESGWTRMWMLSTVWLLPIATGCRQPNLTHFSLILLWDMIIIHISCVLLYSIICRLLLNEIWIYEMTPDEH